jgi:hypothetical protein
MDVCDGLDVGCRLSLASTFFHGSFFTIPIVNYPKDSNGASAMSLGWVFRFICKQYDLLKEPQYTEAEQRYGIGKFEFLNAPDLLGERKTTLIEVLCLASFRFAVARSPSRRGSKM